MDHDWMPRKWHRELAKIWEICETMPKVPPNWKKYASLFKHLKIMLLALRWTILPMLFSLLYASLLLSLPCLTSSSWWSPSTWSSTTCVGSVESSTTDGRSPEMSRTVRSPTTLKPRHRSSSSGSNSVGSPSIKQQSGAVLVTLKWH